MFQRYNFLTIEEGEGSIFKIYNLQVHFFKMFFKNNKLIKWNLYKLYHPNLTIPALGLLILFNKIHS